MEFHLGLPMKPYYDTNVYEDEYLSFHKLSLSANTIIENMFAQIDDKGDWLFHLYAIANHRVNRGELKHGDYFIISKNVGKQGRETTKGWEILLQWKDRPSS